MTAVTDIKQPGSKSAENLTTDSSFLVVEGPIGVGKTSLARRLAHSLNTELLLERPDENPFLERFYQDPGRYALATQLCFMTQRFDQLTDLTSRHQDGVACVADFLIDKDMLFARHTLGTDEFSVYQRMYQVMEMDLPAPDLVIYLQAPTDVLLERVSRRGRGIEQQMQRQYLEGLVDAYARYFLYYNAAPLLVINAESINFVDNDNDYHELLKHVRRIKSGRHFFNPMPSVEVSPRQRRKA